MEAMSQATRRAGHYRAPVGPHWALSATAQSLRRRRICCRHFSLSGTRCDFRKAPAHSADASKRIGWRDIEASAAMKLTKRE